MGGQTSYKASIRKKLVIGISGLAFVTFGFSAIFIFFLADFLQNLLGISSDALILLTLVKGIFWSGVLGYVAAPLITKPLREVEVAARKAAEGDIEHDINVSQSDDEIRALGLAYNEMLASLRSMVKDIDENFNQTNQTVSQISAASELAATKAVAIGGTMDEIARGAESTAEAISTTAESMEEVTSIATKVQARANESKSSSDGMVNTLTESRKVVDSLVEGIKQLALDNQKSLSAVDRLEQQAKEVGEIISLVGDIAGQTNLLALNASIEAARAGEHGKGFAVVADEVRKLADESATAVQGITNLIHNIQAEVKNVAEQITNQVELAMNQSTQGEATNKAIFDVEKSVHEVAEVITDISEMINRQMISIQNTTQQSQEVAAIAEQTSAGSLQISAMTEQQGTTITEMEEMAHALSNQAKKLKLTIERFKV
ncbi:methyl-accepting chemotaxis protein [Halalkalibacter akibai]|uniref:Methyl-accepting chemotaxis protein n=1 Tax=Halalkalibacter akibai (strain ATCC 43226 / DSM 21942 / CIP 109018 / JCM 9157 / 1139) TaxID=1236973 RepID=W4QNZ8_HALA3|nr:HAMP domain-containing methyl-accepting chemotaxis protein [Halalkalibacter akibai]GAE33627.1 methyl-accepting chemotaxis protein [Halalkalibacter akibai JCM 9157]